MNTPSSKDQDSPVSVRRFLETVPPGRLVAVQADVAINSAIVSISRELPKVTLYCEQETCGGLRIFSSKDQLTIRRGKTSAFLNFSCRNCRQSVKTYAVSCIGAEGQQHISLLKFGEYPAFGPPTPARVIKLVGPDKDYFLKGRRAENQDLGIAAFAYYRRVVENQKGRILDEIIRVSERLGASNDVLEDLRAARAETLFSKAVEAIKHGIPENLLIDGHNPLTLLHSALSEGLHAQTDEECLELATSIRVVLADLAERMGTALKDDAELANAVNRLFQAKASKGSSGPK